MVLNNLIILSLHRSITPILHYSNTPLLHHSITPLLHYSITPSLHFSSTGNQFKTYPVDIDQFYVIVLFQEFP
ncbi:MAG: hypothetical protein B6D64_03145 [Bacteroidetes bacterium 4484_276]|nr:MAG: hypothetical protein B6D64_03145 [Bacteroidetes bacterium 4484_276]